MNSLIWIRATGEVRGLYHLLLHFRRVIPRKTHADSYKRELLVPIYVKRTKREDAGILQSA